MAVTKAGKVWGMTELIALVPGVVEFHRIETRKGGVCSKHAHQSKTNGFYVESGKLLIRVWQKAYDLVDETILEAGDYMAVPPGVQHQFECLEDAVAFELYYAQLVGDDIVRESVGYQNNVKALSPKK
jgi:quercetin dioxygenase-like cupin family protein